MSKRSAFRHKVTRPRWRCPISSESGLHPNGVFYESAGVTRESMLVVNRFEPSGAYSYCRLARALCGAGGGAKDISALSAIAWAQFVRSELALERVDLEIVPSQREETKLASHQQACNLPSWVGMLARQ
jgi:hypothetical protein